MTGEQKIEAAFSPEGTPEIPVALCYEGIFIRDHWPQLTDCPWWYLHSADIDQQIRWMAQYAQRVDLDWTDVTAFYSRRQRRDLSIEPSGQEMFHVEHSTGRRTKLRPPVVGGWDPQGVSREIRPARLPQTFAQVDQAIPPAQPFDLAAFTADGRDDLARLKLAGPARGRLPLASVASPFCQFYWTWGFEGTMLLVADRPDLLRHAGRRFLDLTLPRIHQAAALGAKAVWIEETMTDLIHPEAYRQLHAPLLAEMIHAVRAAGMKSIYYYCGNPWPKIGELLSVGADALSLEESKKDFTIDIERLAQAAAGRCTLLGNLDAIGVLQDGGEEQLRAEIARQIAAGRANRSRFILCLGSPVTPGTPLARVQRFIELARQLG